MDREWERGGVWEYGVVWCCWITLYIFFLYFFFSVSVLWQLWTSYWPTFSRNTHKNFVYICRVLLLLWIIFWRGVWLCEWLFVYHSIITSSYQTLLSIILDRNCHVFCSEVWKLLICNWVKDSTIKGTVTYLFNSILVPFPSFFLFSVHDINCIIKMQTIKIKYRPFIAKLHCTSYRMCGFTYMSSGNIIYLLLFQT